MGCETKKSKKRDGVDKSLSLARESRIRHPIETAEIVIMICSSMRIENLNGHYGKNICIPHQDQNIPFLPPLPKLMPFSSMCPAEKPTIS